MNPTAGTRVGPYEILGRLGRGGMGLVFSAWDSRLHRDVAIKLLREEFVRSDSHERFLTEARAASGLNHPNICTIFDIGEQDENPYLVMELLKGETLRARISAGPMSPEDILCVGCEVADALAAAHARGIIHRDIKPANIFLVNKPAGGFQTKVLDFGLAKIELADGLDPRYQMTGAGSAVGTVAYMSPEQARGEALDARSDLFALGIVLYEMATGHVPFEGITSALIFVQLLSHPPEPVREFNPGFPKEFERVILKLLSKERGERYQTSLELLEALRKIDVKKSAGRVSLFSKPTEWVRHSVSNLPLSKSAAQPAEGAEEARLSERAPESSKPSGEVLTIRPIKRQPLPPTELPASAAHWTRAPLLGGVNPVAESSGSHVAAGSSAGASSSSGSPSSRVREPTAERVSLDNGAFVGEISDSSSAVLPAANVAPSSHRKWFGALAALFAIVVFVVAFFYTRTAAKPSVRHHAEGLMLGSIANHSGDKSLDGVVLEGLRLALAQSPHMSVPDLMATAGAARSAGLVSVEAMSPQDTRRAAGAAHATSFMSGEIRNEAGNIIIGVKIYNAATGAQIVEAEETAGSREQIADAIDRLSAQIRTGLGESGDAISRTSVPLARDASSNVEALEAYVAGVEAENGGHPLDAMVAYRRAVMLEPKFTQVWLQLAEIYRGERAEVAAADAATHAQEASVGTSERTRLLAEASYQLNATADYPKALALLDEVATSYPLDVSIGAERALLLRAQAEFPEALEAAQDTLARNPYDLEASAQAEYAMLMLDRGEAAARMESQTEQRGQRHPGFGYLLGSFGEGDGDEPEAEVDRIRAQAYRAQVLDGTGQLAAGMEGWRAAANTAKSTPALASAASYALAQAALDHALTSDCATATMLANEAAALPRGQTALFAVGMAQGLCGDVNGTRNAVLALMAQYPQSFAVKHYYLANLTAIDQIRSGDPDSALATLQAAKQYDLLSLTPYLRGVAHSSAKDWPAAIADFQSVLLHRGATTLMSAPIYAMSQLGLARAYTAGGDKGNSATAYSAFLETWKAADASNALVVGARKHLK